MPTARVRLATAADVPLATSVSDAIRAEVDRGVIGMALRPPEIIAAAIRDGRALIATPAPAPSASSSAPPRGAGAGDWAAFCYLALWDGGRFVSTSGLIVLPAFRSRGLARALKERALALSRQRFPDARPFGLSTAAAVVAINRTLGYRDASYGELPGDPGFWKGCESCPHHATLLANRRERCHCTAMVLDTAASGDGSR